jgi:hypothetical protein
MKGKRSWQAESAQPQAAGVPKVIEKLATAQNSGFSRLLGSGLALPFSKYVPQRYRRYRSGSSVASTVEKDGGLRPGVLVR